MIVIIIITIIIIIMHIYIYIYILYIYIYAHTHTHVYMHTHTHDSALTTFLAPLTPWIVLLMRLSRAWAVYYTILYYGDRVLQLYGVQEGITNRSQEFGITGIRTTGRNKKPNITGRTEPGQTV